MFDVQVKRIHEYKRQHLNILHVIALYHRLKSGAGGDIVPRTFIFGGKAAPGYHIAKLMIKLINSVGAVLNRDPETRDVLRVVFLPNFNVTNGQRIYPAADLSEQISTAGKEASGTGNMKFSMNGALTIGTLDGANVELRTEVGAENFFLFGLDASEVEDLRRSGYRPYDWYRRNAELATVVDLIRSGFFSRGDPELFEPLLYGLMNYDPYLVFADFAAYVECQRRVERRVSRPRALDADVDPERGAHGKVLVRSHDPRVLPRHLARAGRCRSSARRSASSITTSTRRSERCSPSRRFSGALGEWWPRGRAAA